MKSSLLAGAGVAGACGLFLAIAGCEAPELPSSSTTASAPAAPESEPPQTPTLFADAPPPLPEDETPVTDVPRKFDAHDPIKGRRSREVGGYMGATAAAKFYAEYQSYILAMDHANQLYWGEHGDWPKSHEEFMKGVVEFNKIPLPEIPADEEYIYVPEQGDVGLQIRLIPGSPRSKLPAPAPGQEHVYDPQSVAAAGVPVPGLDGAPPAGAETPEQPAYDIRSRAEQLGERGNSRAEDHGVAPGGLVPVGGLE